MIEQDTIRLLRRCDAGIKMGISAIDEVLPHTRSGSLREMLLSCKDEHEELSEELMRLLCEYGDGGKGPNPIVKGMSWLKTEARLIASESDRTIASIMTDGCNMGVKSLSRYLNEYKAADEKSKSLAKRLISSEMRLCDGVRSSL